MEFNNHGLRRGKYKEVYGALYDTQQGKCAICKSAIGEKCMGKWQINSFEIDHSHKTGKIRGLLCRACNSQLGAYELYTDTERYERWKKQMLDAGVETKYLSKFRLKPEREAMFIQYLIECGD